MDQDVINEMAFEEFDSLIQGFIARAEPDALSFEALQDALQGEPRYTVTLTGVLKDDRLVLQQPDAPVRVRGNEIVIGDLRLRIELVPV